MSGDGTKAKKVSAFWWLAAFTVAYFVIYYLLIAETEACKAKDGYQIQDHWFHGFWDRYLACRKVNELGDALAGAFAPVAFLWLAGAVLIQSKELGLQRTELELQRKELDETQQVMREQLDVARQQVDETRATTALLKAQGDAITDERRRNTEIEADTAFNAMKDRFAEEVNNRGPQHLVFHHAGLQTFAYGCHMGSEKLQKPTFDRCIGDLKEQVRKIEAAKKAFSLELADCDVEALSSLAWDLKRMLAHLPKASLATKIRAEGYKLPELIEVLDWMIASNEEVRKSSR